MGMDDTSDRSDIRFMKPSGPIHARVVLTGDPKRAMDVAAALMERPIMVNLSRGLWGYSGATSAGVALTVQSCGIGYPSALAVFEELVTLGMRAAVRIGACRALSPDLAVGDVLVAETALLVPPDGDDARPRCDPTLTTALSPTGAGAVIAAEAHHYDPDRADSDRARREAGATVADLSTAELTRLAARLETPFAALLVVSEDRAGRRLAEAELDEKLLDAAPAVQAALQDRSVAANGA